VPGEQGKGDESCLWRCRCFQSRHPRKTRLGTNDVSVHKPLFGTGSASGSLQDPCPRNRRSNWCIGFVPLLSNPILSAL